MVTFVSPKTLCRRHGLTPHKSLGQHFLLHPDQARRLVAALALAPEDTVVEIGAGLGGLTVFLVAAARQVVALEVDLRLAELVRTEIVAALPNVQVLQEDVLGFDFTALSRQVGRPLAIIGNLPYQITSPLLFKLLQEKAAIGVMVLMMQLEVGQRLLAKPGGKEYGILSVLLQYHFQLERLFTLGPQNFYPPPKVESVVLRCRPRPPEVPLLSEESLLQVVKGAFATRRKTLKNTLGAQASRWQLTPTDFVALLQDLDIDPQRRPETLTVVEFVRLSNALASRGTIAVRAGDRQS
ncbi:MAG: 16S rRNA (adenine(1518)-N(6)/adenine(1519)-N(6))-dimethyltransferase RsmA [Desulfobacca sp.]|uniref:16S rRNA (adenine(1518)-N(6)/adenine(1519)-N(6))- dimethyltransferase RsmA n=1 Tax=Desulfobacca sp. TaxID=2067990 RepID=UPI00404B2278